MARKDNKDKARQDFNHSPFKSLKGLSVSEPPKMPAKVPAKPPVLPDDTDDRDLFAREMAWLNVRPVAGKTAGQGADDKLATPVVPTPPPQSESAEFLSAVGKLDKTFRDELPTEVEPPRARPRRMKQLERGELKPSAELDLHGLTRDEAVARTRAFLAHAARQKWPVVVIVTGKGLRSAEGPVLRRAIEDLLASVQELVLEWGEAPRRLGGTGALAVFVRSAG
jgi:DNA-nicking Smr family endonuclease